jgi:hypothetical protein
MAKRKRIRWTDEDRARDEEMMRLLRERIAILDKKIADRDAKKQAQR